MKKILTLVILIITVSSVAAQDIKSSLDAAQTAYASNQQLDARDNLQQVLIGLNQLIGEEILAIMPSSLGGLDTDSKNDNIISGTGFASLMVSRTYGTESTRKIEITLANESPMLAMVNTFLSNEILSGLMASQTGQKRVTISGYKGMLEKNDGDGKSAYTLYVPLDDSLYTFESLGFDSDNDVIILAQQIKLDKIVALLK